MMRSDTTAHGPINADWLNNFIEMNGSHLIGSGGLFCTQSCQVSRKMSTVSNNISFSLLCGLQDINLLRIITYFLHWVCATSVALPLTFPAHASFHPSVCPSHRRQCTIYISKRGSDGVGGILKRGRGSWA